MSKYHLPSLFLLASLRLSSACPHDATSSPHQQHLFKRDTAAPFPPQLDSEESTLVNSFSNNSIEASSYFYTHGAHVAGTNRTMAQWTADRFAEHGFTSSIVEYNVYLNYPVSHSLSLAFSNGSTFTPSLQEDVLAQDETTSYPNRIPTFHGYSATGDATAEYVYVGRGQQVDFDRLKALGVPLEGKIALSRYGGPFRGLKVKNAQENGMIGAIIFTDTADDGNVTEANGYTAYPDGPARNPSSVQRGSVQFLSQYPGDPTTPGYPSKEGSPRADKSSVTPRIPSLPISWKDAQPLLRALDGYGTSGDAVNRTNWVGKLNATYSTGPNPGAVLSMSNVMRDAYTPIWDAIGIINGTSPDEVIVIGNHRDAWIIGGAADPNSGTAILIELSKAFGALLQTGWKPRRTIVLASWDAEEYGLLGSTEWVEEYIPWLTGAAVSYLNIDVGCSGPRPDLSATPELHSIAMDVMHKVIFPQTGSAALFPEQTFYDVWYNTSKGAIAVLGSGSDYTAFLHKGISSLDVGSNPGETDAVYHYHSNYDSYHWMATYADPGFHVHVAMGQYLTLLAYHLAHDEIIPYNTTTYVEALDEYFADLKNATSLANGTLDFAELESAIGTFGDASVQVEELKASALQGGDANEIQLVNSKYRDFQRGFVSQGGLPGREFFQHVAFAPGLDTGYAPTTFPGVTEAVEGKDFGLAQEWVGKTARGIERAAEILKVR